MGGQRWRYRCLASVLAVVVVASSGASSGPVTAQEAVDPPSGTATVPAIGAPGSTDRIALVATTVRDGWRYDHYRNPAYPCAATGDSTFTIGTKLGTPTSAFRPLWVYMHGGGFGHFDETGTPQPNTWHMREETVWRQIGWLTTGDSSRGGGLLVSVRDAPAGYRMLAVSMCGHDGYGGPDIPDPNNPNLTDDGRPRTVNGLYATTAAISFARRAVLTDDIVLHGSSAGSFGAWHVAWSLSEQGLAPAAVIADSGILGAARVGWLDGDPGCSSDASAAQHFRDRLHPAILDPDNEPGDLIADGRISSPVLDMWVGNDPYWCGDTPVRCPVDDGPDVSMGASDCMHEGVRRAIAAQGPSSRSRSMELCVDEPTHAGPCDRHAPSVASGMPNTAEPWPEDYLGSIMAWTADRLADDGFQPSDWPAGMSFATAAVVDLLGREDRPRSEAIVRALFAGSSKTAELGRLTRSREWLEAIVQELHHTTLGRAGDEASVAYWVEELASGRRSVANVAAAFYASPEYLRRVGGTTSAWISDLYLAILGRPASDADVGHWADQVRRRGRSVVAYSLVQSPESAGDRVAALYQRLLGRAPSAEDTAYWGPRVRSESDLALASRLAAAPEYQARAERRFP